MKNVFLVLSVNSLFDNYSDIIYNKHLTTSLKNSFKMVQSNMGLAITGAIKDIWHEQIYEKLVLL